MVLEDTLDPFRQVSWIARLLERPATVVRPPRSREPKPDTEDSLVAETLKSSRTIRSWMSFYEEPVLDTEPILEVSLAIMVGDGMNGHPEILHGGIVATLIDEAMGIYLATNSEKARQSWSTRGELSMDPASSFTAELKVRYLKPVRTPGAILVSARSVKREGRKEWLSCEVKQWTGQEASLDGQVEVCATGEALFIQARQKKL